MARGGKRNGTVGKAYGNRADLQGAPRVGTPSIPKTAPSSQYGEGAKLQAAQSAVPMGGGAAPTAEVPQPTSQAGAAGAYLRETERPEEPVTAGIASGPGAGPRPGAPMQPGMDVLPRLQAYYAAFPSEGLREMIEDIMMGNG